MISKRIDRLVELTKWPAAVLSVLALPLTFYAWWKLFFKVQSYPGYSLMFAIGVGLFVLLARTTLAQSAFARKVMEFERDLTQSVLAFAMLHPVVVYGANKYKGSRVRWLGRGNWIILAAPYFVPTTTIILWLFSLIFFQSLHCLVLGFGISYHLTAVALQCRLGTSDTRRLGNRFCWMFLPATNFLVTGLVAAYALNGFASMGDFLYDWLGLPRAFFGWIWENVFSVQESRTWMESIPMPIPICLVQGIDMQKSGFEKTGHRRSYLMGTWQSGGWLRTRRPSGSAFRSGCSSTDPVSRH